MNKYENAKIYKLTGSNGLVYYGSTIRPLNGRLSGHKNKRNVCSSKSLENMKIELVENYPCNCKRELETRERWFIENNECINILIPMTTREERLEYHKQYAIKNKEQVRQQQKRHRIKNKDKVAIYNRQHYAYKTSLIGILGRNYF